MNKKPPIVICMGSSCFARGNNKNLRIIEEYFEKRGLPAEVEITGSCCEKKCSDGPNVVINGKTYSKVDTGVIMDLLKQYFP